MKGVIQYADTVVVFKNVIHEAVKFYSQIYVDRCKVVKYAAVRISASCVFYVSN